MLENGWQPHPFRQFLLKVHSRCNLACDYCYVYTLADQSWRSRPMIMAPDLITTAAERIAEHAARHHLSSVRLILHGGEPLLAGPAFLRKIVETVRAEVDQDLRVDVSVQTNAVLLDEDTLRCFRDLNVQVGVSLDGGRRANDAIGASPTATAASPPSPVPFPCCSAHRSGICTAGCFAPWIWPTNR
ncbi:radical SAM protein [Nonomuraea sp. NPDC049141]|uniref:radical SAM protein n=1 Tax=Nonomuraea sp. NPDC049141 TaxID=3155500 RepID=UPI0034051159